MLRFSAPVQQRIAQADHLNVTFGGGEANKATSLAQFGLSSCFVTKLPENPLGQSSLSHLRRYCVNKK